MRIPARLPTASGCLAAICTAGYCQNWVTSQALRDPAAVSPPLDVAPEALVRDAMRLERTGRRLHLQRAADHQRMGRRDLQGGASRGLMTAYVSNGNGTPHVLEFIRPWIDLYKVDLKSFDDRHYRQLGGRSGRSSRRFVPCMGWVSGSSSSLC